MLPFRQKRFDELYAIICEKLTEFNKTEDLLKKVKVATNDGDRIAAVLNEDPEIVSLFTENIEDWYQPKCLEKAQELNRLGSQESSLEKLNKAICLCPLTQTEECNMLKQANFHGNAEKFIDGSLSVSSEEAVKKSLSYIPEIFNERSKVLFEKEFYQNCVDDIFLSVICGYTKTFDVAFRLGMCYKNLQMLHDSKIVLQHSLELLRQSSMDNQAKSKETMKVVKAMKDIGTMEKEDFHDLSKSTVVRNRLQNSIDTQSTSTSQQLKLFGGSNKNLRGASQAVILKYNEQRGRHVLATKTIPPGMTVSHDL
jgi:hypothetical protein